MRGFGQDGRGETDQMRVDHGGPIGEVLVVAQPLQRMASCTNGTIVPRRLSTSMRAAAESYGSSVTSSSILRACPRSGKTTMQGAEAARPSEDWLATMRSRAFMLEAHRTRVSRADG